MREINAPNLIPAHLGGLILLHPGSTPRVVALERRLRRGAG